MEIQTETDKRKQFVNNMMESAIRIGLLFILIIWTYDIIRPFVIPVLWGAILAVALMPITQKLEAALQGRRGLTATILVLLCITLLITPFVMVSGSLIEVVSHFTEVFKQGEIKIPGPTQKVADIPIIGSKLFEIWSLFSTNLEKAITHFLPEIKTAAAAMASVVGSSLSTLLMFIVSLAIAAGFMAHAEASSEALKNVTIRIVGKHGAEWTSLTAATIRSVLLGVVGVALIQAILIGAALFTFNVPAAGLIAIGVLILGIAQLPALIVVLPLIGYMFSTQDTTTATIFSVWVFLAGLSDNFLKPMLMGRGVDIPMPVILFGAIGGMLATGIIGLFLGAVILAIWYELFLAWLRADDEKVLAQIEDTSTAEK
ncbi:AI-2E family transporter [Alkalimarinus sediminis]|uniref:AI-2E family transporter n=1 Tax=Alkalimarinus sediminis TaxID=1632866 RepID=A0A9E8KPL2_9ALTE|nr:AI-2E family transporter [Alkalimarinus sediminis]UZW74300.1 AI-2E family transporter [Alkalimarinus sediminis]